MSIGEKNKKSIDPTGFWKWRSIFHPCTESCLRVWETGTLWRIYGLTYLHSPCGLEFLVGKKKSKSLCFWCILKMPSIKIFWLSHITPTHTHTSPSPPQKKTSTHYISEFFVCATFHSCIGSQTSGNRWVKETWIFHRLRSGAWLKSYWKLFHIWRPNRPRCRCLFSWKFPIVDFCWSRNAAAAVKSCSYVCIYIYTGCGGGFLNVFFIFTLKVGEMIQVD